MVEQQSMIVFLFSSGFNCNKAEEARSKRNYHRKTTYSCCFVAAERLGTFLFVSNDVKQTKLVPYFVCVSGFCFLHDGGVGEGTGEGGDVDLCF